MDYWKLAESCQLLMQRKPRNYFNDINVMSKEIPENPLHNEMVRIWQLGYRAIKIGRLRKDIDHIYPTSFIRWAKEKKLPVPSQLYDAVKRYNKEDFGDQKENEREQDTSFSAWRCENTHFEVYAKMDCWRLDEAVWLIYDQVPFDWNEDDGFDESLERHKKILHGELLPNEVCWDAGFDEREGPIMGNLEIGPEEQRKLRDTFELTKRAISAGQIQKDILCIYPESFISWALNKKLVKDNNPLVQAVKVYHKQESSSDEMLGEDKRELGLLRREKKKWDVSIIAGVQAMHFCEKQESRVTRDKLWAFFEQNRFDIPTTVFEKIWKAIPEEFRNIGGRPKKTP